MKNTILKAMTALALAMLITITPAWACEQSVSTGYCATTGNVMTFTKYCPTVHTGFTISVPSTSTVAAVTTAICLAKGLPTSAAAGITAVLVGADSQFAGNVIYSYSYPTSDPKQLSGTVTAPNSQSWKCVYATEGCVSCIDKVFNCEATVQYSDCVHNLETDNEIVGQNTYNIANMGDTDAHCTGA